MLGSEIIYHIRLISVKVYSESESYCVKMKVIPIALRSTGCLCCVLWYSGCDYVLVISNCRRSKE